VKDVHGRLVVPISAGALQAEPWLQWNAFAALLSHSSLDELHPSQVQAWWVFAYDSELQGGGHAAFFEQHGLAAAEPAAAALRALGADQQAGLLLAAADRVRQAQGNLEDLDAAVEVVTPSVTSLLEQHLAEHLHEFVFVVQEGAVEQPGAPDKVRR